MARAVVIGGSLTLLPLLVSAQTGTDLRAQIRADIAADPRSAEMSPTEIDALVSALAEEAEASGVDGEYLESHSTFSYASLFSPPEAGAPVAQGTWVPLVLAVLFLGVTLSLIIWFIFRRKPEPGAIPE